MFGGHIVDFAIIGMARVGGKLQRVASADICHGELHVHVYNRQEQRIHRECMRPISTQRDVDEGYGEALDRFGQNREHYNRRWQDG